MARPVRTTEQRPIPRRQAPPGLLHAGVGLGVAAVAYVLLVAGGR